jgi:plastocyanin
MWRLAVCAVVAVYAVELCGCGSNGTNSNSEVVTINIQQNRFFPPNVTIRAGDRITWVNVDSAVHQVVSGTLAATGQPVIRQPIILINENNTFVPNTFEASLGDTVRWQNNRMAAFLMDIVDSSNVPQITLSFVRTGQIIGLSSFPGAGFYTYQQQNNPNFFGTIKVFGRPIPDGNFSSLPLPKSGPFTTQFPTPGAFPFFDLNQDDPDQSFMTGTITVQ